MVSSCDWHANTQTASPFLGLDNLGRSAQQEKFGGKSLVDDEEVPELSRRTASHGSGAPTGPWQYCKVQASSPGRRSKPALPCPHSTLLSQASAHCIGIAIRACPFVSATVSVPQGNQCPPLRLTMTDLSRRSQCADS